MINVTDPNTRHVMQGQWCLSERPNDVLFSILGSCVSACMHDPVLRIGGMNHFLLPGHDPRNGDSSRYGARSMQELVNALLRKGANRNRLEVWLFGGANVLGTKTGIGAANGAFATEFVRTEGFVLRGSDLGGTRGRRLRFHPATGKVEMSLMSVAPVDVPTFERPLNPDVELF